MRGVETLMVAGLIGLIGVAVWQGRHWFPGLIPSSVPSAIAAGDPGIAGVAKDAKERHKGDEKDVKRRFPSHSRGLAEVTASDVTPRISETLDVDVIVPMPGVPTSDKLTIGTTRSELRERYGAPNLGISASREGGLVERYFYLNPGTSRVTVATLQNGRLVSAQTVQR